MMVDERPRRFPPSRLLAAAVLLVLCSLPFVDLGRRTLWSPDEPRYAVEVREMAASGDFVVPTHAGRPRIDKPPLFVWAGAVASRLLGGVSELSVRLPSAISAVICLIATYLIGARLFDGATALAGAVVLGTCGRFLLYSQWAATDMMLASLVTLAIAAAVAGRAAPAGGPASPSLLGAGILFGAACALGTLAKGPVGIILPAGVVLLDHVAAGGREPRRIASSLRGLISPWVAGAAAFAALAAPWYLLLHERIGWKGIRENLLHQNVDRFLEAWNAQQPWYFYFKVLPMDFLPWAFFLPLVFVPWGEKDSSKDRSWRFLRIWFLAVFAFFSTASGKSPEYLMPLLPAASLMTGRLFILAGAPAPSRRLGAWLAAAAGLLLSASATAAALAPTLVGEDLPGGAGAARMAALLIAAGAAAFLLGSRFVSAAAGAGALAAAVILVRLGTAGPLIDAGNQVNVAPAVGRALARLAPEGTVVGVGRKGADHILYYSAVPVTPLERPRQVAAFVREGPPRVLVLKGREYLEIASWLDPLAEIVGRWGDGRRGFVALRIVRGPPGPGGRGTAKGRE